MIRKVRKFSFVAESFNFEFDRLLLSYQYISARSVFNLFNYNIKIETLKIYFFIF